MIGMHCRTSSKEINQKKRICFPTCLDFFKAALSVSTEFTLSLIVYFITRYVDCISMETGGMRAEFTAYRIKYFDIFHII